VKGNKHKKFVEKDLDIYAKIDEAFKDLLSICVYQKISNNNTDETINTNEGQTAENVNNNDFVLNNAILTNKL